LFYFLSLNPTAVRVQTRQHDSYIVTEARSFGNQLQYISQLDAGRATDWLRLERAWIWVKVRYHC